MFKCAAAVLNFILVLSAAISGQAKAAEEPFVFLQPRHDAAGKAVTARTTDGREVPVAMRIDNGALARRLETAVATGAAALLPALDGKARALSRQRTDCPDLGNAVIVFLSEEDGGYARKDLFLQEGPGAPRLCADYYIDITVDPKSIDDGEFEEVLSHEYGHVLLRRLLGPIPPTMSRNAHSILTVTDPTTAFDEGFGEHFQPIALALTQNPGFRERARDTNSSPADYWLSRRETRLREIGIPRGDFQFDHQPDGSNLLGIARWRAAQTDWSSDPCRLRSGEQMMASEGVAATLFYRLIGPDLRPQSLLARYDRLITVLAEMGRWGSRAPMVDLVSRWIARYPDDRAHVLAAFLEATAGATFNPVLREQTQALSCTGASGRMARFVAALKDYRATIKALLSDSSDAGPALAANLAPEIWLADPQVHTPAEPWSDDLIEPLVLDLNTTDEASLAYLLKGDSSLARRLVAARADRGFANVRDAILRAGLDEQRSIQLLAMEKAAENLPPFTRQ